MVAVQSAKATLEVVYSVRRALGGGNRHAVSQFCRNRTSQRRSQMSAHHSECPRHICESKQKQCEEWHRSWLERLPDVCAEVISGPLLLLCGANSRQRSLTLKM